MAKGVNKVILIGNLGNDPDIRYTPTGSAVTTISLATTDSWKDKQSGELQDRTEWHRVVFFGRLAEIAGEYLRKGAKIYAEGSLRSRKWQDKTGTDRYTTEIIASEMQMLDSKINSNSAEKSHIHNDTTLSNNNFDSSSITSFNDLNNTEQSDSDDDIPF